MQLCNCRVFWRVQHKVLWKGRRMRCFRIGAREMLTNANLPNLIYQRTIIQNPATSKLHIFKKICYTKALMTNFEDFWAKMIWWSFFSQYFSSTQGSTNCDILASGMRGSGDRERKWEDKFHPQVLKKKFSLKRFKNGSKRAKTSVFVPKVPLFWRKFCLRNIRFQRK